MSESFIVAIRIRPPSHAESNHPLHRPIICPVSTDTLVFDPPSHVDDWDPAYSSTRRPPPPSSSLPSASRHKDLHYAFDHVFDERATQADVYAHTAKKVICRVLDGYNATVFAYGATGCGQSYPLHIIARSPTCPLSCAHRQWLSVCVQARRTR